MKLTTIYSLLLGTMIGAAAGAGHWMATEPMTPFVRSLEPITVQAAEIEEARPLSQQERDLLAAIVYAEANTEDITGKRLVIDTILNRVASDRFPGTIWEVIYQPYQYWTAGMPADPATIPAECYAAIDTEPVSTEVLFFRTGHYHGFAVPVLKHGNHYFSR